MPRLIDQLSVAIIIVTQRVHADDLVGHVLERFGEVWTVLDLPAIAPSDAHIPVGANQTYFRSANEVLHSSREPRHILDTIRQELGSEAFAAQYLQCPVPPGGNLFKREWLNRHSELPIDDDDGMTYQSWDTASKTAAHNDYSVCTTWRITNGKYYLLDLIRGKFEYPELKTKAIEAAQHWQPSHVLIEDMGVGTGLIAELTYEGINAIAVQPTQSKLSRASIQTAKFEAKRVLFPQSALWLSELEAELLSFPAGRHDDQVDSIVQMLGYEIAEASVQMFRWDKSGRLHRVT